MRVGSLFAGIGGFDLGLERAGFEIAWQVEIDPYCQRILAKHWPDVQRYGDIRAIDWSTVPRVDLLCGGFPCQDLSFAGKRAGIDGERSGLWSEYVRAIRAIRPRFILVENVPGLLTNEYMGRVLGDLAQSGYDAEWDCLPASAFGAHHRRDRVWITANSNNQGPSCAGAKRVQERSHAATLDASTEAVADANAQHRERGGQRSSANSQAGASRPEFIGGRAPLADTGRALLEGWGASPSTWWATEPNVGRVAHGVPHRVDRLRGLGNAIVPQIAEWLGRQIMKQEAL